MGSIGNVIGPQWRGDFSEAEMFMEVMPFKLGLEDKGWKGGCGLKRTFLMEVWLGNKCMKRRSRYGNK